MFSRVFVSLIVSIAAMSATAAVRYEGRVVTEEIQRTGKDLTGSARFQRQMSADVDRVFTRKVWVSERLPMPSCRVIPGNGNGDWKGYWAENDMNEKALRLSLAIQGLSEEGARQIVRDGYLKTLPRNWREFSDEIRRADNQPDSFGYAPRVLGTFGEQNRRSLGYVDREPDVQGNGDWKGYWEANRFERAGRLARAVRGLGDSAARQVVEAGVMDSLPRNWREFADRILRAERIHESGFSYEVLVRYGRDNMRALGFFDPKGCDYTSDYDRVLKTEEGREYDHTARRAFDVQIQNSPLLKDEKEQFTLSFDGFKDSLQVGSNFYRYTQNRREDSSGAVVYELTGQRVLVTPSNNVRINGLNQDGRFVLDVSDLSFDAEQSPLLGELIVNIEVWQSRVFFDKKLGDVQVKLPPGQSQILAETNVKPEAGSKVYAYYWIQRPQSRFHNQKESGTAYSPTIRF